MNELHTFKAGALIPGVQAFLSGVFVSGVLAGVLLFFHAEQAGVLLLSGASGCAFITYLFLLRHWLRLVDVREGVQPVQVLEPEEPAFQPSTVRIELIEQENGALRGDFLELPATFEQLRLLASGVASGVPLTEHAWTGARRPFTKAQFHELRSELVKRGWCNWRNVNAPAQGVEVSRVGRRVFHYLSESGNHLISEN